MMRHFLFALACLLLATVGAAAQKQESPDSPRAADTSVVIGGEVDHPRTLSLSDLLKLPQRSIRLTDHHGSTVTFEGVLLSDVLTLVGAPQGEKLRGRYLASFYLLVTGAGGNGAIFALPEVDPTFTDRETMLAYRANGQPISADDGPLQIIVPTDKRHGRWVRHVTGLTVARVGS